MEANMEKKTIYRLFHFIAGYCGGPYTDLEMAYREKLKRTENDIYSVYNARGQLVYCGYTVEEDSCKTG
jgi:hypothetical protein